MTVRNTAKKLEKATDFIDGCRRTIILPNSKFSAQIAIGENTLTAGFVLIRQGAPMPVNLVPVDPSLVNGVWPHAGPLIKRAMDRTDLGNFGDVEREVLGGLQQLWLAWNGTAIEAAAVTRLVLIGSRKICVLVACGGHGRERWLHLIAGIEQFARNEGCAAMRIIGRKGWQRILADYRANYVVMDREL